MLFVGLRGYVVQRYTLYGNATHIVNTSVIRHQRQLHAAIDTTTQRNWPSTAFTTVIAALQSWPLAAAGLVNTAIVLTIGPLLQGSMPYGYNEILAGKGQSAILVCGGGFNCCSM